MKQRKFCGLYLIAITTAVISWFLIPCLAQASQCNGPISCGNGILDPGEECDDGNLMPGDGCAPDCTISFDMEVQQPILTYASGYPRAMARADLNNDGIQDFVVTSFRPAYLYTYLISGNGTISLAGTYNLGSNTRDVKIGNLNGDHFADVVTTDLDTDEMHVFFGNGDGTLTLAKVFVPGDRLWLAAIGDIDNDGFDDLIVASMYTDGFKIYYGDGQGDFPRSDFIYTGGDPFAPMVIDLNHDGYNDLVLTVNNIPKTLTYFGGPNGLTLGQDFGFGGANTVAIDLNNDGYMDLATYGTVTTPAGTGQGLHLMINQGDGTFVEREGVYSGIPGWVMDVADFNNDGNEDIVISTRSNYVRVFLGDGQGGLLPELHYPLPMSNDSTLVIDLNLDGLPDFLVSGYYNDAHREVWPVINHNYYEFPVCGDSRIGNSETCDDGNSLGGDGCSAICKLETTGDSDHDGLTDAEETILYLTDPLDPDTDHDCVFDGDEICSGHDPLDPSDQSGCQAIVTPPGSWKIQVTLLEATAGLSSDIYLARPVEELLIKHSLKHVGKIATTEVLSGETVGFFIRVDGDPWGLGTYDHDSDSSFARVSRIDSYSYRIGFEDLPVEMADWDYNDAVLLVQFIPVDAAQGISRNALDEFQAAQSASTMGETNVSLAFDGFSQVTVPMEGVEGSAGVVMTAGLADLYADHPLIGSIGQYRKVMLTNGQDQLTGGSARITIAYDDDDGDGFLDGTTISELDLAIYRFDEDMDSWVKLESDLDPVNNLVSAETDRLSLVGVAKQRPPLRISCGVLPAAGIESWLYLFITLLPALAARNVIFRRRRA